MRALEEAGTVVCQPILRVSLEIPTDAIGLVMSALGRLGGAVATPSLRGGLATIATSLPAAHVGALRQQLPGLTSGDGVLESSHGGYEPVSDGPPARRRTRPNPLDRGVPRGPFSEASACPKLTPGGSRDGR